MKSVFSVVMVVLGLCFAASAFATASVEMVELDKKSWTVQARDFDNVSGIELTITYDATVLGNPTVKEGSFIADSIMTSNTNEQGTIRIAIVTTRPLTGGGPIVKVSFQSKGSGSPKLKLAAKIVNKDLAPAPVIPLNPPDQASEAGDTSSDGVTTNTQGGGQTGQTQKNQSQGYQPSTGSSPIVYGGTVTMPSDTTSAVEENKSRQPAPEYREEQHREAPSVAREKAAPEARQETEAKHAPIAIEPPVSILERFRAYKGEVSIKALTDLFVVDEMAQVKQDPPILLTDGKAELKLTVPNPQGKQAPNFALKKAKLVSLKVVNGAWVVAARPEKGAHDASVTMLVDDTTVEMPLVVAPKLDADLDRSGKTTEDDFRIFLKERGTEKAPKYDLNKDGRRDYVDDYLFTANYLVLNPKAKERSKAAVVPEVQGTGPRSDGGRTR